MVIKDKGPKHTHTHTSEVRRDVEPVWAVKKRRVKAAERRPHPAKVSKGVARWWEGSKRRREGQGRVISRVVKIHSREKQPGSHRRCTIYRFIGGSFPRAYLSPVSPPRGWHIRTDSSLPFPLDSPPLFHFIFSQSIPPPPLVLFSLDFSPSASVTPRLVAVSSDSFLDVPRSLSASSSPSGRLSLPSWSRAPFFPFPPSFPSL